MSVQRKSVAEIFPHKDEVKLPNAPLVVVVAQIRFDAILSIESKGSVTQFQEMIRADYPELKETRARNLAIQPDGNMITDERAIWRFSTSDGKWVVSLARDFLAIETRDYDSRKTFLERFTSVANSFSKIFKPVASTRIGIRYIDQLTGANFKKLDLLVNKSLLGAMLELPPEFVEIQITESLIRADNDAIYARWGLLPKNGTIDPSVLPPATETSWILDIDSFMDKRQAWATATICENLSTLAANSYGFFRWSINPEFLKNFGGKV